MISKIETEEDFMRWVLILIAVCLVLSVASIPSWNVEAVQSKVQMMPGVVENNVNCLIAPQYPNGEICVQTIVFDEMEIAGSISAL